MDSFLDSYNVLTYDPATIWRSDIGSPEHHIATISFVEIFLKYHSDYMMWNVYLAWSRFNSLRPSDAYMRQ